MALYYIIWYCMALLVQSILSTFRSSLACNLSKESMFATLSIQNTLNNSCCTVCTVIINPLIKVYG